MKTVLITGANGFIGRELGKKLSAAGYDTIGVARRDGPVDGYGRIYQGALGEPLRNVFTKEKIDAVIHCANASGSNDYELNTTGTTKWADQARAAGVQQQIFLSSISVLQQTPSSYARAKKELEHWFVENGQTALRLGVVIGNGGIFNRMKTLLQKMPILPLLDNGVIPIYFSGIDSVCTIIEILLQDTERARATVFNLQQAEPVSMRQFLNVIKKQFNYFCWFVPVPSSILLYAALLIEKLGIRFLPISSVNIKGARQNRNLEIESDYPSFGLPERTIEELIQQLDHKVLSYLQ